MRIFFGIVLIIIGLIIVYYLPEVVVWFWPTEGRVLSMTEEFWLVGKVSSIILGILGIGLVLLFKKPKGG